MTATELNKPAPKPWILVFEDDDDDYMMEVKWMREGIPIEVEIIRAANGVQGMDILTKSLAAGNQLPGIIIMDLNMPRMGGKEVLKQICGHPVLRKIRVVVLTTSRAPEDEAEARSLGAASYLCKPDNVDDMHKIAGSLKSFWENLPPADVSS